jgi:hypothetical protein
MSKAYQFFRQEGFLPINKESYALFKSYAQYSELQEMSAVMLTTWSFVNNGLYKVIHGYLCGVYFYKERPVNFTVHRSSEDGAAGCSLRELVDMLYGLSVKAGLPFFQIKFIEERFLPEFEAIQGYEIKTEFREEDSEYVYRMQDFIELNGKINLNKRKRLNKCFKEADLSFRPISGENIDACLEIQKEWCRGRDCSYCESFAGCEKKALEIMVALFDERFHSGLLLYQGDSLLGYCICEIINEKTAFAYFGKSLHESGLLYILYTISKTLLDRVEYINLDEDMGEAGIRLFKRHLGAYFNQRRYMCTFIKECEGNG